MLQIKSDSEVLPKYMVYFGFKDASILPGFLLLSSLHASLRGPVKMSHIPEFATKYEVFSYYMCIRITQHICSFFHFVYSKLELIHWE